MTKKDITKSDKMLHFHQNKVVWQFHVDTLFPFRFSDFQALWNEMSIDLFEQHGHEKVLEVCRIKKRAGNESHCLADPVEKGFASDMGSPSRHPSHSPRVELPPPQCKRHSKVPRQFGIPI